MYIRGFLCKLSVTWHILPLFCHILFMAPPTAISVACCLGICGGLLRTTTYYYTMYCTTYIRIIQQEVRIIHSGLIGCFLCSNNFTLPHCNTEQKVMKISRDQVVQCPKALWSWVWASLTETLIFYYVFRDLHKQRFLNYVRRVLQSEAFTG